MANYVCGVDLGQRVDPTALVIIEMTDDAPRHYSIRHTERWKGLEYHQVAQRLKDRLSRPPLGPGILSRVQSVLGRSMPTANHVSVIVDESGVGVGVTEILERVECGHPLTPVTITAGTGSTRDGQRWRVSKSLLISTVDALLDTARLTVGQHVPGRDVLLNELTAFRRKYTAAANEVFMNNAREAEHDDLVLATALACWAVEHGPARPAHVWFLGGPSEVDPATGEFWW